MEITTKQKPAGLRHAGLLNVETGQQIREQTGLVNAARRESGLSGEPAATLASSSEIAGDRLDRRSGCGLAIRAPCPWLVGHSETVPASARRDQAHRVNAKFRQAFAAVITDLKSRGLRNDSLVVCGSEFGRTPVREVGGAGDGGPPPRTEKYVSKDESSAVAVGLPDLTIVPRSSTCAREPSGPRLYIGTARFPDRRTSFSPKEYVCASTILRR